MGRKRFVKTRALSAAGHGLAFSFRLAGFVLISLVFLKQGAHRVPRCAGGQTSNSNVKSMSTDHWRGLFRAWSTLPTPVRVASEAIDGIKAEVAGISGPVLLLGMTSGLL